MQKKALNSVYLRKQLFYRLRYRKGHGVHSPFVYNLITKVIEEKAPYYAFEQIAKLGGKSGNYGKLLFRLINYFHCDQLVLWGDMPTEIYLYAAMALPEHCCCHIVRESVAVPEESLEQMIRAHGLGNLHCTGAADLPPLNEQDWHLIVAAKPFDKIKLPELGNKSILLVDNIGKDKKQYYFWEKEKLGAKARVTIETNNLGLIFFDSKLPEKHYKTYFNYG